MKRTSTAGEFLNSPNYQVEQAYDVRHSNGLVVILMDNGPAVVTAVQWEKACAIRLTWDAWAGMESSPDEDLHAIWLRLMGKDIAGTPRGKRVITEVTRDMGIDGD